MRADPARHLVFDADMEGMQHRVMQFHPNDPLHGVTLENVLRTMVDRYGWPELAERIPVRCFMFDPTIKSSLTFLRKTPWARKQLEDWYVYDAM